MSNNGIFRVDVKNNTNDKCWQNVAILDVDSKKDFNLPSRQYQ